MNRRIGDWLLLGTLAAIALAMSAFTIFFVRSKARTTVPVSEPSNEEQASWEKSFREHFERPWLSRRGVESIDYDASVVFARAPVERFAAGLAGHAAEWQKDVLGREVVVASSYGFVFRLEGHPWSLFVASLNVALGADALAALSRSLGVPVIQYACSDTAGVIGYELFEGGRSLETFAAEGDHVSQFRSERDAGVGSAGVYDFVGQFLKDHDAYEPSIGEAYFFGDGRVAPRLSAGSRRKVGNPGFFAQMGPTELHSTPDFERVDYLVFNR
jgi:hypothetical protein